jgi:aminoglycoside phosphotransferase (APT) family kinase protein
VLPGGQSEPRVVGCDHGESWVLKLPGNPQASAMGRDFLGLRRAYRLGTPVPDATVAEVDEDALATMASTRPLWA